MRILFVIHDSPNNIGGPVVNARRLLPELQRRGHSVHCLVMNQGTDTPSAQWLAEQGVLCYVRPWSGSTQERVRWILQQVIDIEPDVFIPNLSVQGSFASRWVRAVGIPTVAAHRSDDEFYWGLVDVFVCGEPKWAVSGLVCVSEQNRRKVERRNPARTLLCTIPSGVPIPAQAACQSGPLRLAYVGRMVETQKRIRDLVAAVASSLRELPEASATFYGEGPEVPFLKEFVAAHGMSGRIHIAGGVPPERIHQELLSHHVLVLLSDYEGTPGAVMDGMACGLVPVCLDIPGGVRELVIHEKTGLLVKNREKSFVEAVVRLATDPAFRATLALNAREHIHAGFSLEVAARRWEEFLSTLCKQAGPRRVLRIPRYLGLPPIHPGLACEDCRDLPAPRWAAREVRQLAGRAKRALLSSWKSYCTASHTTRDR